MGAPSPYHALYPRLHPTVIPAKAPLWQQRTESRAAWETRSC